jgi:hypothetical protein
MMPRIMCNQTLWRALPAAARRAGNVAEVSLAGLVFGGWAAKSFRYDGRDLVVAVEDRTHLTLVCPFGHGTDLKASLADALHGVLTDLHVAREHVVAEAATIDFRPLIRLADRRLAAKLNDVQFYCELELGYHEDLRRVQLNLNELPHPERDPCIPREAVVNLFATIRRPANSIH